MAFVAQHQTPLDFFSWHNYGGLGGSDWPPYAYVRVPETDAQTRVWLKPRLVSSPRSSTWATWCAPSSTLQVSGTCFTRSRSGTSA